MAWVVDPVTAPQVVGMITGWGDEMLSPLISPPSETPKIRGQDLSKKIPGKPDNSFFSVPVENTPLNRSVCQNTAENHPSQSPPTALEPRHFSPPNLAHPDPENPTGMPL